MLKECPVCEGKSWYLSDSKRKCCDCGGTGKTPPTIEDYLKLEARLTALEKELESLRGDGK